MRFLLLIEKPASALAFSYGSLNNQSRINNKKNGKRSEHHISAEAWGVNIQIPVTIHE
jgi:hypothetical protein